MHQAKAVFMMVVYDTPESWLRQAIESVLQQTCPDLYLLIQDNGSTGRTAEILREYAGRDTRIVLFRNEVNNAMTPEENAAWWNLVCRYTLELESEYFAVLDSDDSYAPDFLEVMYQIATEKQADLVVCGTTMVDESGEKTLRERLPPALALDAGRCLQASLRRNTAPFVRYGGSCSALPFSGSMAMDLRRPLPNRFVTVRIRSVSCI